MSYIDINKAKEKVLYRVIKEVMENGRSFIQRDTRVGQRISKSYPEFIVTSNRRKNITTVALPLDKILEENDYANREMARFHIRSKTGFNKN